MTMPNFVLLMTDTQPIGAVGCYGRPGLETGNIDRLARDGVLFERAYCACPVCTPARSAIFTGIYPSVNGAYTNNLTLGSDMITMGRRLCDGGYRSAYIGKWHLDGLDYFGTGECPDGWDDAYWYDGRRYLEDLSDEQIRLWRSGLRTIGDLREKHIGADFTWAHRCSDRAIDFLRTVNKDACPFLLVVSYDEPHEPSVCPPEFAERFIDYRHSIGPAAHDTLGGKPSHQQEWAASESSYRPSGFYSNPLYFGCNSFVDSEIGRVIEAIDRYAPSDTFVIYSSDHGDMFGAHRIAGKGPVMYDEITRVPLIIRPPKGMSRAMVSSSFVSHVDLMPTLLDLAGMPIPPILHGRSLAPMLEGEQGSRDESVLIEFNRFANDYDGYGGFQPIRCLVSGHFKLVVNLLTSDELYDLEADPAEMHNCIQDSAYAAIRDELHDRLLARMAAVRDPFRGPCWERRPWRSSHRAKWAGGRRHTPDNGYAPSALEYSTGRRPVQWVDDNPNLEWIKPPTA